MVRVPRVENTIISLLTLERGPFGSLNKDKKFLLTCNSGWLANDDVFSGLEVVVSGAVVLGRESCSEECEDEGLVGVSDIFFCVY